MALWNFCHNVIGMHMYYVLAIVIGLIMAVSRLIQRHNQNKRDKDNEEKLNEQAEARLNAEALLNPETAEGGQEA